MILSLTAEQRFEAGRRDSYQTLKTYTGEIWKHIRYWRNSMHLQVEEMDDLLVGSRQELQDRLLQYLAALHKANKSYSSRNKALSGIKDLYVANEVELNWDLLSRALGSSGKGKKSKNVS